MKFNKPYIFLIFCFFIIICWLVIKQAKKTKEIVDMRFEKELLMKKAQIDNRESAFQLSTIGKRLYFDSVLSVNKGSKHVKNYKKIKILVIDNLSSCQKCTLSTLRLLGGFISKNNLGDRVIIYLLIPTGTEVKYKTHSPSIPSHVNIIFGNSSKIMKGLNIGNSSIVAFFDINNICFYSYLIVSRTPKKTFEKLNILMNFLDNGNFNI